MTSPDITFQRLESRQLGLLCLPEDHAKQINAWVEEDHKKLMQLCKEKSISDGPNMFYQLALALARELYPERKKPGRKSKWNDFNKGILVLEVERTLKPGDPAHGVEWACTQLSKRTPWKEFLDQKHSIESTPDPSEALRKIYYEFKDKPWAEITRNAFRLHEYENTVAEWDQLVADSVRKH